MNEHQTDELIVTDVDEWLDDDIPHLVCGRCAIAPCLPGVVDIAICGKLYRIEGIRVGPEGPVSGTCETCLGGCPRCGA